MRSEGTKRKSYRFLCRCHSISISRDIDDDDGPSQARRLRGRFQSPRRWQGRQEEASRGSQRREESGTQAGHHQKEGGGQGEADDEGDDDADDEKTSDVIGEKTGGKHWETCQKGTAAAQGTLQAGAQGARSEGEADFEGCSPEKAGAKGRGGPESRRNARGEACRLKARAAAGARLEDEGCCSRRRCPRRCCPRFEKGGPQGQGGSCKEEGCGPQAGSQARSEE